MKLRYKVLSIASILVLVGFTVLAVLLSHDSACGTAPPLPPGAPAMQAIRYRCYGPPSVVRLEQVEKPVPAADRVLVRVHAASVNPLDWHYVRGLPYVMRAMGVGLGAPDDPALGVDFAGTVEAVGSQVTDFKPGDEVYGGADGAFGQYVTVRESRAVALKPSNLTFEQAAAVPIAAVTALQALRDAGRIQSGQKVLINGASGGVGTFAVQIAKSFGAEVTGVSSTRNLELVRSLGADHVIDYTREDFTQDPQRYDLILDCVGNRPLLDYRRVLTAHGIYVGIGGGAPADQHWIGPLIGPLKILLISPFVSQKFLSLFANLNHPDLVLLHDLMEAGKVTPVIDRRYPLSETADALSYLEQGHARGKIVIDVR